MTPRVACVIPAYDAAATVGVVARGVRAAVPDAFVIGVDDGSRDATRAALETTCDVVVAHARNAGKGAALRAGFAIALARDAAHVLTIDADGQHDPAAAPALLAALEEADLAIGARARRRDALRPPRDQCPRERGREPHRRSARPGSPVGLPRGPAHRPRARACRRRR